MFKADKFNEFKYLIVLPLFYGCQEKIGKEKERI